MFGKGGCNGSKNRDTSALYRYRDSGNFEFVQHVPVKLGDRFDSSAWREPSQINKQCYCVLDAPNAEAIHKHHAKAGIKCDWVQEVESTRG
ncbi:MAG: DUF4242 domain-containing protein [Proteobacteria bacterium]|nr:DUF4242 domain-containing protein [Pseudomonadota bacterium]